MFIKDRNGNWRALSCLDGIISCIYRTDLSRQGKTLAKYIVHCNIYLHLKINITLQWRHNGRDSVSNHQPHECLLNRLFRRRSKKASKLRVTGLCAGNSPGTGEFPAQMASNAENVSIWWRHHYECVSQLRAFYGCGIVCIYLVFPCDDGEIGVVTVHQTVINLDYIHSLYHIKCVPRYDVNSWIQVNLLLHRDYCTLRLNTHSHVIPYNDIILFPQA